MKVRKQMLLPAIMVLMTSVMLVGCSKLKAENNTNTIEIMQTVTAQTASDTRENSSTEEIMPGILDHTVQDALEENEEDTTQKDSADSNTGINTEGEMMQEIGTPKSETFVNESEAKEKNEEAHTETHTEAPEVSPEPEVHLDFVAKLNISKSVNQMIVVSAKGSGASVTMHEIQDGIWTEIMSTSGYVGQQGVGSTSEEVSVTPAGIYSLSIAFGVNSNPGTSFSYTKVDDSYYWVDDSNSPCYNHFVSTKNVVADWNSAEHLIDYPNQYAYAIAIDYNTGCVPGAGSAIFLHCSNGNATGGCVAIPQDWMVFVLNHIHSGCVIVIDKESNISNY